VVLSGAVATSEGHGPFRLAHGDAPTEQVMLFHLFGLALFATCVAVGFAVEERVQFERALKSVNRNLHDLALLDSLTGVQNRRGFEEAMQLAWSNALAAGQDVSLLYLDIDFFKLFNDAYGHQQGDECLTAVAAALVGTARAGVDCVARYGGEEFVVILPGTSADAARVAAERIQAAVLSLRIPHRDSPFGVISISLGLATLRPTPESAPAALIHLADEALYGAKRNGRNRIESHPVGGPSRSSANAYAPTAIASLVPNLDTQIPVRGSAS
jgi:diguanylate cyclase (GGDEF)-like protein